MSTPEQLAVASEAALLREKDCPTDAVCFHAQRAVEKYLKALLATLQTESPKTHNIRTLVQLLGPHHQIPLSESEQNTLTDYATSARYPGFGVIPLSETRRAVSAARRVRKHVRSLLPKEALRWRKR